MISIIDAVLVGALLALIENGGALIDTSGLHDIVFHLGVLTFGTPLLYYHLALSSTLSMSSAHLVLVQPLLVLTHSELRSDDLACIGGDIPANYWKLSSPPQIWQWMVSLMV